MVGVPVKRANQVTRRAVNEGGGNHVPDRIRYPVKGVPLQESTPNSGVQVIGDVKKAKGGVDAVGLKFWRGVTAVGSRVKGS